MQIRIDSGVLNVGGIIAEPEPEHQPDPPPNRKQPEPPPSTRQPYFDLGDGQGKAGEIVEIQMLGGCRYPVSGFHIGAGCAGEGKLEAQGFVLGPFLQEYFNVNNMGDAYWSGFNMATNARGALPMEWWDVAVSFFSLSQTRSPIAPIQIPVDTLLFTLQMKILEGTPPGEYEMVCRDEYFYTQKRRRRRDFLYTTDSESEFARGGVTRVDCQGGRLTVTA